MNKFGISVNIRKYFNLKIFPMHMQEHSVLLYKFRIISLDCKRTASGIMVRFTKSGEKELHAWLSCVATKIDWQRPLKCSREYTNVRARYAVAVIEEGMTISHH